MTGGGGFEGGGHFWAGGVVFASQFLESSFDMSLSQQFFFRVCRFEDKPYCTLYMP